MTNATWEKVRRLFPNSLLAFKPQRELTIGEWIDVLDRAGYRLEVRVGGTELQQRALHLETVSTRPLDTPPMNGAN